MNGTDRRVIAVTGASAGVGRATVQAFATRGCSTGLIARGTEGLEAAADVVRRAGAKAVAVPADVTDADAVEGAADRTAQYSSEPARKDAPDNLFKPIEGDFGAHGRFDSEALPTVDIRTPVLRAWFIAGGATIGVLFAVLRSQSRRRIGTGAWPAR